MYAVSFIYYNLSSHFFPFSSLQGNLFLSPRTMDFFHRYHHRQLTFPSILSISLSPMSVTTRLDCCYHRQLNPKPSYFHHFVDGRVAVLHEEASLNEIQNGPPLIIDHPSPGGGSREGVLHKCSDIYTPHPKTAPDQGVIIIYSPSRETPQCWCARSFLSDPRLGGGGCCVAS